MNKEVKIRLGIKDESVRNWWDKASQKEINISKTINYAIEYYIRQGDYINIAKISSKPNELNQKPVVRKIYLPSESITYKWLSERAEQGEAISSVIKRIIRNSILINDDNQESFINLDELIKLLEVGNTNHKEIVSATHEKASEVPEETLRETPSDVSDDKPAYFGKQKGEDLFDVLLSNGLNL